MKAKTYFKKILIYCVGLFIMALGVSISKVSHLGVSPVNSIPAVQSTILNVDMGICTTMIFTIFILIQIAILRKEFKLFNLLQIIPSFLFGAFVSGTNFFCDLLFPETASYFVSIIYLIISMVLISLGILFYLNAEILSLPGEGVIQAISHKSRMKLSTAKIMFDWSLILVATILSLAFLGELNGIREGTVIAAVGVGMCLKLAERFFEKNLRRFLYGTEHK